MHATVIEDILESIRKEFPEARVAEMLDEEILNWVHSDWEIDGYDSEYEWYSDYGNGEAEDVVAQEMIRWWVIEHNEGKELGKGTYSSVIKQIGEEYNLNA